MLRRALLILAVTLAIASSARSQTSFVTFEGLADGQVVGNYYESLDPPVIFGSELQARIDSDAGGTGTFENEPSPSTVGYTEPLMPGMASGVVGIFMDSFGNPTPVRSVYLHYTALAPIDITLSRLWPLPDVHLLVAGPFDTDGGLDDWFAVGYDAGSPVITHLRLNGTLPYAIDNLSFSYGIVPELGGQPIPEAHSLLLLLGGMVPPALIARRRSRR